MKKISWIFILCNLAFLSLKMQAQSTKSVKNGPWRGELSSIGGQLPMNFTVEKGNSDNTFNIKIQNGAESFNLGESYFRGDSLVIPFDLYDSEIISALDSDHTLTGFWVKRRNGKIIGRIPFKAKQGSTKRFIHLKPATINVTGKWNSDFWSDETNHSPGVGVFEQKGNEVTGTFLKPSGDYRFLQGNVSGDSLFLSYFDGSGVYLLKTKLSGKELNGQFSSGFAAKRIFKGKFDPSASLPDLKKLTFLKDGYDRLDFKLPAPNGEMISLQDDRFKNKVVVIELLGSWCPNCLDESRFLAPFYRKNKEKGLEVLGLSFEYSPEMAISGPKIENFKKRIGIDYPILFAGVPSDETIKKVIPMINQFYGYPTTFIVDRKGRVREIHTGFSGPGTGAYYTDWTIEFEKTIDLLLKEK
ncbi:peroxiredoxin family protein [Aquirufa sp. ROCK2-A2]